MKRIDFVGRRIGKIEGPRGGAGLDHVVEPGIAGGHALDVCERNRLIGFPRILDVDDRAIVTAGEDQVAVRRHLQRIGVALRHDFDLASYGVQTLRAVGQDGRRQQQTARPVAVHQFHQRRIAGAVGVGVTQKDFVALEDDIVVATCRGRIGIAQGTRHLVGHGIDQRQRRVAVLILQRPDLASVRIVFQAVDGTRNRVGVLDISCRVVLDDRARTA